MSVANSVFNFISVNISAAPDGSPYENADPQPNLYEEIKEQRTIRVGDVQASQPSPTGSGAIREFNAFLTVQHVAKPASKKLADLNAARAAASAMAMETARLIFDDETLGGGVCDCSIERKEDDWKNVGTTRHAVSYLLLRINKR